MSTYLILGIVIAMIIWIIVYSFSEPSIDRPIESFAEIKEFISKGGSGRNSVFEYSVNGKVFNFWGYYNNTLVIGDKFVLVYDSEKPKESKVIIDRPIFLENEKTKKATGKVVRIKSYSKKAVYFEYVAGEGLYTRIQCLPDNYSTLYPALLEGKKYKIEYWQDNPQRAIIHLDQPL